MPSVAFGSLLLLLLICLCIPTIIVADFEDVPTFTLFNGNQQQPQSKIPMVGLGVYRTEPGDESYLAVHWALQHGYRLIDTAAYYENEESVGEAIHDSEVEREDVWVTTKLPNEDHGFEETMDAMGDSLERLELEYLDMYLIHSPYGGKLVETWDAMIYLQQQGLVNSIGVSNFGIKHLEAISLNGRPLPSVNQIEMHPLVYKKRLDLIEWCKDHNILIQAYGSIFSGSQSYLGHEILVGIAIKYGRSPAQVLLRWAMQHGFQIIPKSAQEERIISNMEVFDFSLETGDMAILDNWEGDLGEYWNPIDEADVDLGDTDNWPTFEVKEREVFEEDESEDEDESEEDEDEDEDESEHEEDEDEEDEDSSDEDSSDEDSSDEDEEEL